MAQDSKICEGDQSVTSEATPSWRVRWGLEHLDQSSPNNKHRDTYILVIVPNKTLHSGRNQ
jgi:hypothetical protein